MNQRIIWTFIVTRSDKPGHYRIRTLAQRITKWKNQSGYRYWNTNCKKKPPHLFEIPITYQQGRRLHQKHKRLLWGYLNSKKIFWALKLNQFFPLLYHINYIIFIYFKFIHKQSFKNCLHLKSNGGYKANGIEKISFKSTHFPYQQKMLQLQRPTRKHATWPFKI